MLGTAPTSKERTQERLREKAEDQLEQAETVINAIASKLDSLAYAAPECQANRTTELIDTSNRVIRDYRKKGLKA
jgi:hypothetical protein